MADKTKYAQWIIDNQDKKGTPEFDAVVQAYQAAEVDQVAGYVSSLSGLPPGSALEKAANPASQLSTTQRTLAGAGKAFTDIGRGVGDITGLVSEESIEEARDRDAPLMETGAGQAGNILGSVAAFAPTMAIPGANTYTGAVATGAAVGALQPTVGDESRLANTMIGGGAGAGGRALFQGAGALKNKVRDTLSPFLSPSRAAGRALNEAAGTRQPEIVQALRTATPGQTSGQAAARAGSAEFSAAQRLAANQLPSDYAEITTRQNLGRTQQIRQALGGADDVAGLQTARRAATEPLYSAARQSDELVDVSRTSSLIDRVIRADPANERLKTVLGEVQDSLANNDAVNLMSASRNISRLMTEKSGGANPVNETILRELRVIKRALDGQIARKIPQFGEANKLYQEMSRPIDQARIGQLLTDSLDPALTDFGGEGAQSATRFANALRNAPQTIRRATGFKRSPSLESVLTDQQMAAVTDVAEDLANNANFERLARQGMRRAGESLTQGDIQLPGILKRNVVIINSLLGRTGKRGTERLTNFLAENMQNPQVIAELMENTSPQARPVIQTLVQALRSSTPIAAAEGVQ